MGTKMGGSIRHTIVLAVAAFFAVMWGLLLRENLFPKEPPRIGPDYESLLPAGEKQRSARWRIMFAGKQIGHSETTVTRSDGDSLRIEANTTVSIPPSMRLVLGASGTFDIAFEADISPLRGLESVEVRSNRLDLNVLGTVRENTLTLTGHSGRRRINATLPYEPHRFMAEAFSPLAGVPRLRRSDLGKEWTVDMLNPITGNVVEVTATPIASIEVSLADGRRRAFKVLFTARNAQWVSWVDDRGRLLVQGTPFGVTVWREGIPLETEALLASGMGPQSATARHPSR